MTQLFEALRRVARKDQGAFIDGAVFIDGHKAYRHWMESEDTVVLETTGTRDVAFADQEVQFDDNGAAQASDTSGQLREVRILVMVPFGRRLQVLELIDPPERDAS